LFDLNDRLNPYAPVSYEEGQMQSELNKIIQDLEQESLFGVYITPEELAAKRLKAQQLHTSLRALKGKAPKPLK
jgi:hypothetical protein